MYAYTCETGAGLFEGMCRLENPPLAFRDPPLPYSLREWLEASIPSGVVRHGEPVSG